MNPKTRSNFKFEQRVYNEDSSPEEIQAIQDSVFIHSPQIIYFKQLPVPNPFSANLLFDKVEELGEQLSKYGLLIDIQESFSCNHGYRYGRKAKLGCHAHRSPLNLIPGIAQSCNSYFANVYLRTINKYDTPQEGIDN